MDCQCTETAPAPPTLQLYKLTYAPAFKPNGVAISTTASRHELFESREAEVEALSADGAVATFERDSQRMVTSCKRVQSVEVEA